MWQSLEILNVFKTLTLKQISEKRKPISKKRSTVFLSRVLRLKMQHFHTKLLCQKSNVKTNKMGSTKWTYYKYRVLPATTLFFNVPTTQMSIFILSVRAGVLFDGACSLLSILNVKWKLVCLKTLTNLIKFSIDSSKNCFISEWEQVAFASSGNRRSKEVWSPINFV